MTEATPVDLPPLDEGDPDSWAGRAFLLAWQGELDEALRSAEAGLARHPASSTLYEVKTRVALLQGNGALAEETVATWLQQHPDDGAAYAMRAEMGPPETTSWEYPGADGSWAAEFAEFLEDIRLGRPPSPGLTDARAALAVVEAVHQQSGYTFR